MPGTSNTATWDRGLPVRSPTSLSRTLFRKSLVSMIPFIYMSALPSWASFTAFREAAIISGSSMIS